MDKHSSLFLLDVSNEERNSVITLTPDHIDKNVLDIFLFLISHHYKKKLRQIKRKKTRQKIRKNCVKSFRSERGETN